MLATAMLLPTAATSSPGPGVVPEPAEAATQDFAASLLAALLSGSGELPTQPPAIEPGPIDAAAEAEAESGAREASGEPIEALTSRLAAAAGRRGRSPASERASPEGDPASPTGDPRLPAAPVLAIAAPPPPPALPPPSPACNDTSQQGDSLPPQADPDPLHRHVAAAVPSAAASSEVEPVRPGSKAAPDAAFGESGPEPAGTDTTRAGIPPEALRAPDQIGPAARHGASKAAPSGAPAPRVPLAQQLSPAIVAIVRTPAGAEQLTLRLDPAELGTVQVAIARAKDAPAHVVITVERAETLNMLMHDRPALERSLDQAGVAPAGRTITFALAPPEGARDAGAQAGGQGNAGFAADGGTARRGESGRRRREEPLRLDPAAASIAAVGAARWLRTGVDITA